MPVLFVEFCRALTSAAQVPSRRLSGPKGVRQSGYRCVYFVKYSQFTDSVLLHAGATEGELPEGQEKEPWVRPQRTVSNDLQTFNRRGGHWPPTQHSAIAFIFHSPFSILHSAHAQFKQTAKKERSPDRSFVFRSISMRPFPSRI